ncbi:hypothetical protein QYF61_008840 [Mycteria americana]|uniref:Uncharacterized protein n=1 Tax=Mycteria americana TaxID=33587 RepID=A0AAN7MJP8_MYCAM|nr:hypothetical protein QYF61_008840 [Mycteria americana]
MHCKGNSEITKGNRKADQLAKEAALQKLKFEGALIPVPHLELSPPQYTEKENQLAEQLDCSKNDQGWWVTPLKQLLISEKMMEILLKKLHQETHSGADALVLIAKRHLIGPRTQSLADIIVKKCAICCANNPKIAKKIMGGVVKQGITPGEYWQIDFKELPRCNLYKYLLVMVDTFPGWPEAFPCHANKAREVIKILLKEIIPRYGVPEGISSDNGPHFIAEIVQGVSRFLDIKWDLHTPWQPQSSGKVERMTQTLKRQISKVCQETQMKWVDILPIALMRVRITPRAREGVSPFEILYGKPYPTNHLTTKGDQMHIKGQAVIKEYLISLSQNLSSLHRYLNQKTPIPLDTPVHPFQPGDVVYVRTWKDEPLKEKWKGPYTVLLKTYTMVKVNGIDSWIHYTRVNKAPDQDKWTSMPMGELKLRLTRDC